LKGEIGGHGIAMSDFRLVISAIPEVKLNAAAAHEECLSVHVPHRLTCKLMPAQIGVMRRKTQVVGKCLSHVLLIYQCLFLVNNIVNPCGEQIFSKLALAQTETQILRPFSAAFLHINLR
jgi:hypothetical protein